MSAAPMPGTFDRPMPAPDRDGDHEILFAIAALCETSGPDRETQLLDEMVRIAAVPLGRLHADWDHVHAVVKNRLAAGDALGAAITLVPERGTYVLARRPDGGHVARAGLARDREMHSLQGARTPALALASAILRALTVA